VPRYSYKCLECEKVFNVSHSMKEKYTHCDMFECEKASPLVRVPSSVVKSVKSRPKKVGQVVNEYIESTKEEMKQEKERLKKEEYKQ